MRLGTVTLLSASSALGVVMLLSLNPAGFADYVFLTIARHQVKDLAKSHMRLGEGSRVARNVLRGDFGKMRAGDYGRPPSAKGMTKASLRKLKRSGKLKGLSRGRMRKLKRRFKR